MKMKKIPMRSCVVSHEKCEKKDLVRIVRTPSGEVMIDLTGKMNGRGAYLKKDIEIFKKAQKLKILDKILEVPIQNEIYDELNNLIK